MPSGLIDPAAPIATRRRVVVVGLGSIGRRHAKLLRERADVSVEVVETNAENLAAARNDIGNLPSHSDLDAALETQPDVIWLATPTPLHPGQAIAALESGAHVFCEKPMSHRLDDARRMQEAAARASGILNIGYYLHFWHGMTRLRELMAEGKLGRLLHAHARVGSYTTLVNSASRYQATVPGSLFFDYSHQPDLFYWLLRRAPRSVWVAGLQGGKMELSSAPNVTDIICEFGDDLLATIHLNYVQFPERHCYEVIGDLGWVELDFFGGWLRFASRTTGKLQVENFSQERDDIFRAEHTAFFEAVEGHRAPETSADDGMVSTAICEAAMQSWRSRERVCLALEQV